MAWQYAMSVQTSLTDIEAAWAAEDYPACLESCAVTMRAIFYCHQIGDGYDGSPGTLEHHAALAASTHPVALALRDLPIPVGSTRSAARHGKDAVAREDDRLRHRLPLEVPVMRSAKGYFPLIGIAADIERLRVEAGLGAMDWSAWDL